MNVAIFGATGFLGKNLMQYILDTTSWNIMAICRDPTKLADKTTESNRIRIQKGDVLQFAPTTTQLTGTDVAYYFVHMMGHKGINFYEQEIAAATNFVRAANMAGIKRIVFMGGLGNAHEGQSMHLAGRHKTGEILRSADCEVIELRASMIIGDGSVAFDIITSIARRMPIMVLPKSAKTKTQPIAIEDALKYLTAAATIPIQTSCIVEVGGPEVLTYAAIYKRYMRYIGRRRPIIYIPFIPNFASSLFLDGITPKIHARIGREMVESLTTEMTVTNQLAGTMFPTIRPMRLEQAFAKA